MKDLNGIIDCPDHTSEYDPSDVQSTNVVVTALTYVLFFLPYVCAPNSAYAKFHANQSLVYLITSVVLNVASNIVCKVLGFVPVLGSVVGYLLPLAVALAELALFILGVVNACNKQAKELPVIGSFTILR